MKSDIITKDQVAGFTITTTLFKGKGDTGYKKIEVKVKPLGKRIWFETTNRSNTIYSGPSLDEAISIYNKL